MSIQRLSWLIMLILGSSVNIGAKRGPFLLPIKQIYDTLYANLGDLSIDLADSTIELLILSFVHSQFSSNSVSFFNT